MARRPLQDAPEVEVTSRAALRDWLTANHGQAGGVWLVTWKKAHPGKYVPMGDIVQECLCFGWVDSLSRGKDADRTSHYISPRKAGSGWSRVNKDHVARLEDEGWIMPPGRTVIAAAKADGSWSALDGVENLFVPPDLAKAFETAPGSRAVWDGYPRSVKRGALEILLNARRAGTRARKIAEILRCAVAGTRPFQ